MKYLLSILILFSINLSLIGQNVEEFVPGLKVIDLKRYDGYDAPLSIKFVFKGEYELIEYYGDLEDRLAYQFRSTDISLDFEYDLNVPRDPIDMTDEVGFDTICTVEISDIIGWDNDLGDKKKQRFKISLALLNTRSGTIDLSGEYEVSSMNHMATQTKAIAEEIFTVLLAR